MGLSIYDAEEHIFYAEKPSVFYGYVFMWDDDFSVYPFDSKEQKSACEDSLMELVAKLGGATANAGQFVSLVIGMAKGGADLSASCRARLEDFNGKYPSHMGVSGDVYDRILGACEEFAIRFGGEKEDPEALVDGLAKEYGESRWRERVAARQYFSPPKARRHRTGRRHRAVRRQRQEELMADKPQPVIDLREYVLQKTEKSVCNKCGQRVHMLAPRKPGVKTGYYYLCETCGRISQSGVGELAPREQR